MRASCPLVGVWLLAAAVWSPTFAAAPSVANLQVDTSRGSLTMPVYSPAGPSTSERPLVLLLSGEGGGRAFDHLLATWLAADGYWVGGLDCKDDHVFDVEKARAGLERLLDPSPDPR